jgi:hypothetical protein
MEKNPNGDERKRKTKRGVFTIWQLNLLALVMDLVTTIGW